MERMRYLIYIDFNPRFPRGKRLVFVFSFPLS